MPDINRTPFEKHGRLSVKGTRLLDSHGEEFRLYGMSTHGLAWFPDYVNREAFSTLCNEWNTNCIRLALYTHEYGGYCTNGDKEALKAILRKGVEYATEAGMYAIIDWHVLMEKSPMVYKEYAAEFFAEMSELYKNHDNVLYEICNEPDDSVEWWEVKSYAEEIIPIIRRNAPNAVIIVGTTSWCQDADKVLEAPLEFDNVLYAVHFYADTHRDYIRDKAAKAAEGGLPLFVSEFSITDFTGDANINTEQGKLWMGLIDKYHLSYLCWSLNASKQACCVIKQDCKKLSGWTRDDLSETGKWVFDRFSSEKNR